MIKIAEVAGDKNTYSVINPFSGSNEYMIVVLHPTGCKPSKSTERILSNSIIMGKLGVNELKSSYASVYPNPTNGVVFIKSKASLFGAKYIIYSSKGEQILTGRISGEITTLNIQNFAEGVYLINIDRENLSSAVSVSPNPPSVLLIRVYVFTVLSELRYKI